MAYRFGPFHLDARERRLSRGGEVIPLRLKVFDTLLVLVENAGRLVTKQELLDAVWPETTVEENNLNHNVSVLRKALGEKATGQQYIATVPRVGYRFVAPVETVELSDEASTPTGGALAEDVPAAALPATQPVSSWRPRRFAFALVGVVLVAVSLSVVWLRTSGRATLTGKDTVLIADFGNTTGDEVFDGTLRNAVAIGLGQSPFLNILSEERVR